MVIQNISCCHSNQNKDTKYFGTKITLLLVLLDILFTNLVVLYTVMKIHQKSFHWKITGSNFVANILYSIGSITSEVEAQSNAIVNFLEIVGQTGILLGVALLVTLQLKRLQSLNINNKMVYFADRGSKRRVNLLLFLLWITSVFLSTCNLLFDSNTIQHVVVFICLSTVCLTMISGFRILTIIQKHKRSIHCININQRSNKTNNLEKPLRFLKGTCALLVFCWIPSLVGKLISLATIDERKLNLKWLTLASLSYPVLYPILYVSCHKDVRRYILKHWINCKSKEEEKVEDFYAKLRNYKQHRRSMQMKPFVLTTEI